MRTITTAAELRQALAMQRDMGKSIGFVPTMGALHDGHKSLVRASKQNTDVTVVSIFVNPAQFGPNEDFARYPRTIQDDETMLIEEEVDFLFLPSVEQIYPAGHSTIVNIGPIGEVFEGAIRPEHFDGVATVVSILFNIVQPNVAYFGQKDAQQLAVIRQLVHDLAFPVDVVACPIIRDENGLALSSRNRYLSLEEKEGSLSLSKTLLLVRNMLLSGLSIADTKTASELEFRRFAGRITDHAPSGILDYLDIVDPETFHPKTTFEVSEKRDAVIIIAARFGKTRLIDNLLI